MGFVERKLPSYRSKEITTQRTLALGVHIQLQGSFEPKQIHPAKTLSATTRVGPDNSIPKSVSLVVETISQVLGLLAYAAICVCYNYLVDNIPRLMDQPIQNMHLAPARSCSSS